MPDVRNGEELTRPGLTVAQQVRYMVAEVHGEGADVPTDPRIVATPQRKWRLSELAYVPSAGERLGNASPEGPDMPSAGLRG